MRKRQTCDPDSWTETQIAGVKPEEAGNNGNGGRQVSGTLAVTTESPVMTANVGCDISGWL